MFYVMMFREICDSFTILLVVDVGVNILFDERFYMLTVFSYYMKLGFME